MINEWLYEALLYKKALVIAPKKVALNTWASEIEKWDHLRHLELSIVLGTAKQRREALKREADIYIINRDNVTWLVDTVGLEWDFEVVVIDELSSFKSHKAQRFRSLRKVRPKIKRLIGLTGTPKPNGYGDLWSQLYLIDQGERLGKTLTKYRNAYFSSSRRPWGNQYDLRPGADKLIETAISDICVSMKAEDYLDLEAPRIIDVPVTLSGKEKTLYQEMEEEAIIKIANPTGDDDTVMAGTAAVVVNKLLQMANGAVYDEDKKVIPIHDRKLEALEELLEEATGRNVLLLYSYKHDLSRIIARISGVRQLNDSKDVKDWNSGRIPLLAAHPASCGHGLNLQDGGNIIIWFGLPWSLEIYLQANARLQRQGQKNQVVIYRLITQGTYDEDVARALETKSENQEKFLASLKAGLQRRLKEIKESV